MCLCASVYQCQQRRRNRQHFDSIYRLSPDARTARQMAAVASSYSLPLPSSCHPWTRVKVTIPTILLILLSLASIVLSSPCK